MHSTTQRIFDVNTPAAGVSQAARNDEHYDYDQQGRQNGFIPGYLIGVFCGALFVGLLWQVFG